MDINDSVKELNNNIKTLSGNIEKLRLGEYIEFLNKPYRVFYSNFMWGLSRGLGMAVGFTILGAIVLYTLKILVSLNLPLIGNFIADIVKIVQENLK